jgi:hypothetical protein
MPVWVTVDAIGRVEPGVNGTSSPSPAQANRSKIAVGRIRSPSPVSVTS